MCWFFCPTNFDLIKKSRKQIIDIVPQILDGLHAHFRRDQINSNFSIDEREQVKSVDEVILKFDSKFRDAEDK
jgi:hypothetical protein